MNTPYTSRELDSLLNACLDFSQSGDQYFATGNIAGREDVSADIDSIRRMMEWVVALDNALLEYSGLGQDNVPYFRLGLDAKRVMANGGFKTYLRKRQTRESLERIRLWAPICISLLALIVSILALVKPNSSSKKLDDLAAQVNRLRRDHEQAKAMPATANTDLGAAPSRTSSVGPDKR